MTTTQYTPGTIIVHEDEAYRILQINDKGHARTTNTLGTEHLIDTNTLAPETTKVITGYATSLRCTPRETSTRNSPATSTTPSSATCS